MAHRQDLAKGFAAIASGMDECRKRARDSEQAGFPGKLPGGESELKKPLKSEVARARKLVARANMVIPRRASGAVQSKGMCICEECGVRVVLMGPMVRSRASKGNDISEKAESEGLCEWMMGITKKNMEAMYSNTWGWDEKQKMRELR